MRLLTGSDHATVDRLLAWYANGTLADDERAMVRAHLEHCVDCRQELARLRGLAAVVSEAAPPAIDIEQQLADLHGRLADPAPPRPRWVAPGRSAPMGRRFGGWALAGGALALLLAAVVTPRLADDYRTLTEPVAEQGSRPLLVIAFAPNIRVGDRDAILERWELAIRAGPDAVGLYEVSPKTPLEAEELADLAERVEAEAGVRLARVDR